MAEITADRVYETSTTTGTGAYTLAGSVAGYRAFSAVCANNDTVRCFVEEVDANGLPSGGWEVGLYTWGTGGTLTRTTIEASSNANAAVNWGAGTRRIGATLLASRLSSLINKPICIPIACSDETTALTAGTAKVTFRMPFAMTLTAVRASLTTAQTSGSIFTVDVNESGTTVLSTKLTIDNTEKSTTTAATAAVISDSSLADDAEITIDIDQVGDGTAKGLKVYLIGTT